MDKISKTVFVISFLVSWITLDCLSAALKPTPYILYFYADWCTPCKTVNKEMNNKDSLVNLALSKYKVQKINFDVDKELVSLYNIKAVPTFVIVIDKQEKARLVGIKNGISDVIAFLLDNE